jgi:hypothetical protein
LRTLTRRHATSVDGVWIIGTGVVEGRTNSGKGEDHNGRGRVHRDRSVVVEEAEICKRVSIEALSQDQQKIDFRTYNLLK